MEAGTKTLERELSLIGNETFQYDLVPSEVVTFVARALTAAEPCKIAVETNGVRTVYEAKPQDSLGVIFSVQG